MFHRFKHNQFHRRDNQFDDFEFAEEVGAERGRRANRERHRRGGPHAGRGGGLGRFFAHGDLRLVVLALVAEKPRHGYELIKAIEERVAGLYSPSPGVIYPTLTMLEELGHVRATAEPGGARKLYAITPEGESQLAANQKSLEALLAKMDEAAKSNASAAAPQIVRAMENLKLALRLRLARGPLAEAEIAAVAKTLDAAASELERS